ncbi:MAG: NAD(P)-binding domain-containing protein [Prevotellaceae bacterium]|jgi:glycerol-3-phosphate dehydrogenase (NAD(P)+)|nr:NAD(P)-binding domain-containing protein [Prevotellaceae bacterium]
MARQYFFNTSLKFCILGSGSWATALMKLLTSKQNSNVYWYIRSEETIAHIRKYGNNPKYLSSIRFDTSKFEMTSDVNRALELSNVVIVAIPAVFISATLEKVTVDMSSKFIVSAVKGIIPEVNRSVSEYFNTKYNIPYTRLGVISGPCHAEEVALERLSYLTFSCKRKNLAELISKNIESPFLKIISSTDVYGSEYAAILKNIYAIGAGICHGLGYGDNYISVFVSNSFEEMRRFLNDTNLSPRQTTRSAYLGDLLVTCYSQFSRNRALGTMIGKGYSVLSATMEMNMVAEGYYASECIHKINETANVMMPIADTVYRILYRNASACEEIKRLSDEVLL